MKTNKLTRIFCVAAAVILCAAALAVGADAKVYTIDEIGEIARGILEYELAQSGAADTQAWIEGALAAGAGESSEWYIIGLRQSGVRYDYSAYADALEKYISERTVRSATTRQRQALALIAAGRAESRLISDVLDTTVGEQGIMSYVFGLHLATNGAKSTTHTVESLITAILSLQLEDGGWNLAGVYSDVDVTAMAVQALAPYCGEIDAVRTAVGKAVEFLAAKQFEGGEFASYGTDNAESVAQVIVALSSLGIDIQEDSRFVKNGNTAIDGLLKYRLPDGTFAHVQGGGYNRSASAQAYYSLVAYLRCRDGLGPLYVFDAESTLEPAETEGDAITDSPAVGSETEAVQQSAEEQAGSEKGNYKLWVILAIVSAAAIVCALFWLTGKRNAKNFIFILALATIASVVVSLVDIKSADEYYTGTVTPKENVVGHVTLSIRCDVLVGVADDKHIPSDGVILPVTEFKITEGETAYELLIEAARAYGIHTETEGINYISGIGNIYEFDYGDLSGWTYLVNGQRPSVGSGEYKLNDGDVVEWFYTLELGDDIR